MRASRRASLAPGELLEREPTIDGCWTREELLAARERPPLIIVAPAPAHPASRSCYMHGCRDEACRRANADYQRQWRETAAGRYQQARRAS